MSRTYRRLDAKSLSETRDTIEHYEWIVRNYGWGFYDIPANEIAALAHSDNQHRFHRKSPKKYWRRMSHQARRAMEREELNKVLKDPDHEFWVDLENQAHRLDLWDWY